MALSNVVATRNSDTDFTVSWYFDGTCYSYMVQRSVYVNGAWGGWTDAGEVSFITGADGGSLHDTTTVADRRYSWRVATRTKTGTINGNPIYSLGSYVQSGNYTTTPAAVTALTATRATDGQVNLAWTNNTLIAAKCTNFVDRWDNVSNTWTQVASGASSSYSVTGLSADRRYQFRVRVVTTDNLNQLTATTTSAYVTMTPAAPTGAMATYVSDTQMTFAWVNASTLGAINTNYIERSVNGGAWSQIATVAGNVSTYTATTAANNYYQFRVRAGNGLYSGYSTTAVVGTTPTAPSGATTTYVSDSRINLAWTNNSAIADQVQIYRSDYVSGSVLIATLASTAVSYQDLSVVADKKYSYTIYAVNRGIRSTAVQPLPLVTTPAAPTNAVARKSGTNITTTWVNNSASAGTQNVEIWHAANGVWDGSALATLSATATSYTHTSVDAQKTHQYRVRAKAIANNTLYSSYATTAVVTLLSAPLAPSIGLDYTVFDATSDNVTVSWLHNPTDSTVQTAAQVRIAVLGSGSWTTWTRTTDKSWTFPANYTPNGATYEIQVCTKGDYASYGPWSASKTVVASAKPTATITSPSVITITDTAKFNLAWTYYDAEGTAQVAWQATLYKGAAPVETKTGTTESSYTFKTVLLNNSNYRVYLKVQDGSGQWSNVVTKDVGTAFNVPPYPEIDAVFDSEQGLTYINVVTPAPGAGEATPVSLDIYRGIENESHTGWDSMTLIVSGLSPTTSFIDYIPPTNTNTLVWYFATVWSALPTANTGETYVETPSDEWVFLNGGEGFAQIARLKANPEVEEAVSRTKVLRQFAGRTAPVEFIGTARSRVYKLSGDVATFPSRENELGTRAAFEAIADLPAPICYRDPLGRRVFVSIGEVSISSDAKSDLTSVSCELTVVDYEEG